jgi:hypothetical protein
MNPTLERAAQKLIWILVSFQDDQTKAEGTTLRMTTSFSF